MFRAPANSTTPVCLSSPPPHSLCSDIPTVCFPRKCLQSDGSVYYRQSFSLLSTLPTSFSLYNANRAQSHSPLRASSSSASVGSAEYIEEPTTNVKFQTFISLQGRPSSLSLLGTGYREKVFAIIGVKVYAAGLYVNPSVLDKLNTSEKGQGDSSLFSSIFKSPQEKSLQIVLVRDIDGKTFWDALNDAISPRIKALNPIDESALSTFRNIFQGRPLKKGTLIFLTWLDVSKMLVSVSDDGLPSREDATIKSENVTFSLFDVFFGDTPVSPSLKSSVSIGLAKILNR